MSMKARSPHEAHRTATPLELLFDLVFVVAIAQASAGLHHSIAEQHVGEGLLSYTMVFFAIWWAWMNFTWFASAYDSDDVPYRVAVFVQITGALILAAGVRSMFELHDITRVTVGGYVVMRLAAVAQWLRAASADPVRRVTAYRYAIGVTLLQMIWVAMLFVPKSLVVPGFFTFVVAEMIVPVWAERAAPTTWHPHHIAERYGLLTIIVLGESILTATMAIESAVASGETFVRLLPLVIGGLLIVYSLWWLYFYRPVHELLSHASQKRAIVWGYGHYLVFASAAAVGAGLAVAVDVASGKSALGVAGAGAAVAIPAAIYVMSLWFVHYRPASIVHVSLGPIAALAILLTPFTPQPALATGVILAGLLAIKIKNASLVASTPLAEEAHAGTQLRSAHQDVSAAGPSARA
jgi:low temperature requirement protein LtrA